MPAPTTARPIDAPANDLFVRVEMDFEGEFPWVAMIFGHFNATDGNNCFGLPKYPRARDGVFTLFLDSRNVLARQRIGEYNAVAIPARCANRESLHSAMANEAYDLLAECVAAGTTSAINALGIEVRGTNPFPE